MAEIDDWIISSTGKTLGGETLDFGTAPNWDAVNNRDAFSQMFTKHTGGLQYNVPSQEITAQQIELQNKFFADYGLGNASSYNVEHVYNIGSTPEQLLSMGYVPPTTDRREEMAQKYGTQFTATQIEGAMTERYGKLQAPQDLGKGWETLYQAMDKWRQQDAMWLRQATGEQDELFPKAIAHQKAAMSAGGMKAGTAQWNRNIENLNRQRLDIQGTYEQKQKALKESSTYKSLKNQYNAFKGKTQIRTKEALRTRYSDELIQHEAEQKWQGARYGRDSETGEQIVISEGQWVTIPAYTEVISTPYQEKYIEETDTGELQYGVNGATPTFDEFWQQNFSRAKNVENPYADRDISNQPESEDDRRARQSASGMAME